MDSEAGKMRPTKAGVVTAIDENECPPENETSRGDQNVDTRQDQSDGGGTVVGEEEPATLSAVRGVATDKTRGIINVPMTVFMHHLSADRNKLDNEGRIAQRRAGSHDRMKEAGVVVGVTSERMNPRRPKKEKAI